MNKTVKTTKTGQIMAFLTIEDLVGTVEVVVFPNAYNTSRMVLDRAEKVFITGRVQANADENGKLICESVVDFEDIPRNLWIRFESMEDYVNKKEELFNILNDSDGKDKVIIYCTKENQRIKLPDSMTVKITPELTGVLNERYGQKNIAMT